VLDEFGERLRRRPFGKRNENPIADRIHLCLRDARPLEDAFSRPARRQGKECAGASQLLGGLLRRLRHQGVPDEARVARGDVPPGRRFAAFIAFHVG
jgi:hypothetical protein